MKNNNLVCDGQATLVDSGVVRQRIQEAQDIVLTVHVHPDGDALGSSLALYEYLKQQGKRVRFVIDDVIPEKFTSLPYVDEICSMDTLGATDTVDLLIVLDASTFERIGAVGHVVQAPILNIDHHVSNTRFAHELFLDSTAAATGEIVTYLLTEWKASITPSMANALYLAISTDCGFYKFSNTTEDTLRAAALCVAAGAQPQKISELVELTTRERLLATQEILQTIQFHAEGRVVSIALNEDLMARVGDDTDGFIDMVRNVAGVDIAILFKAYGAGKTRMSFRSKHTDVNAIASHFNGGGHVRAAGASLALPLAEAISQVIAYVESQCRQEL